MGLARSSDIDSTSLGFEYRTNERYRGTVANRLSKTRKLLELQEELHILDRDIHHVETRQYALPLTPAGMLALPNIQEAAQHDQQKQPEPSNLPQQTGSQKSEPQGTAGISRQAIYVKSLINGQGTPVQVDLHSCRPALRFLLVR